MRIIGSSENCFASSARSFLRRQTLAPTGGKNGGHVAGHRPSR
jgi:hypothetical protein